MSLYSQDYSPNLPLGRLLSKEGLRWARRGLFTAGHPVYQLFFFCLVGLSGVAVNYLVMWGAFEGLGLHYMLSSVCAHLVASVNNYTWNKKYTFQDRVKGLRPILRQYLTFLGVTLVGLAINQVVLAALVELFEVYPVMANLAGVLAATASNFLGAKFITFRAKTK